MKTGAIKRRGTSNVDITSRTLRGSHFVCYSPATFVQFTLALAVRLWARATYSFHIRLATDCRAAFLSSWMCCRCRFTTASFIWLLLHTCAQCLARDLQGSVSVRASSIWYSMISRQRYHPSFPMESTPALLLRKSEIVHGCNWSVLWIAMPMSYNDTVTVSSCNYGDGLELSYHQRRVGGTKCCNHQKQTGWGPHAEWHCQRLAVTVTLTVTGHWQWVTGSGLSLSQGKAEAWAAWAAEAEPAAWAEGEAEVGRPNWNCRLQLFTSTITTLSSGMFIYSAEFKPILWTWSCHTLRTPNNSGAKRSQVFVYGCVVRLPRCLHKTSLICAYCTMPPSAGWWFNGYRTKITIPRRDTNGTLIIITVRQQPVIIKLSNKQQSCCRNNN